MTMTVESMIQHIGQDIVNVVKADNQKDVIPAIIKELQVFNASPNLAGLIAAKMGFVADLAKLGPTIGADIISKVISDLQAFVVANAITGPKA
jgi:hypothetical protein